jgi:thioredoxin reductase (NADPH)
MSQINDVTIIGSGPAGYTAALYAGRARLRPTILEGSVTSGGSLMNTTVVENFPGFPGGVDGPELMASMRAQALRFDVDVVSDDVVEVDLGSDVKVAVDSSGRRHLSRTVILCMGSNYRELGVPSEPRLAGAGISWCATCDGAFFPGVDIAVVGGGDSAMEEALFLTKFAGRVFVVHRRGSLRASRVMVERARASRKIEFLWHAEVVDVLGDEAVEGVLIRNVLTDVRRTLPVGAVFVAIGHEPRSALVRGQVACDSDGYVRVEHPSTKTNVPGVFAAGDLVDRTYRQAVTAAGTGCQAALDMERFLAGTTARSQLIEQQH